MRNSIEPPSVASLAPVVCDPPITSYVSVRRPNAADAETETDGVMRTPALAPKSMPPSKPGVRNLSYETNGEMKSVWSCERSSFGVRRAQRRMRENEPRIR
jgi:hypothetical protein